MPFPAWVVPAILSGASALGNALGGRAQGNALGQAGQINQQATNDAMAQILSLYDQGWQDLAPYRNVGQPALNRLQQMAGHPASSIGGNTQAGPARPAMNALARPVGQSVSAVNNAIGSPGALATQKASNTGKNALLGSAAGAAGTMGLGLASGAMLGAGPGFGASLGLSALGGPVGLGLGLAGSLIASQFGKHNPDKAAASRGTDELSRQTWGTNTPGIPTDQLTSGLIADVRQGRKAPAQGKAEFTQMWNSWVQGMKDAGVDDGIIRSSVETQRRHFQPVHDFFQGVA